MNTLPNLTIVCFKTETPQTFVLNEIENQSYLLNILYVTLYLHLLQRFLEGKTKYEAD